MKPSVADGAGLRSFDLLSGYTRACQLPFILCFEVDVPSPFAFFGGGRRKMSCDILTDRIATRTG